MSTKDLSNPRPFPLEIPFLHDLGVEFLGMENGEAQVALNLLPRHMNGWHVMHGGVTMTLLDVVMVMAGRSLYPDAPGGVTVEMKTNFLQPGGKPGMRMIAKGKAFHQTKTMCFCEGEVWDGDKMVAKAMGIFKYRKRIDPAKKAESENSQ
jgi:acyl-CoA thioesterase